MYINRIAHGILSTSIVPLQLCSFNQLMPKSLHNVNSMNISDLWGKKKKQFK